MEIKKWVIWQYDEDFSDLRLIFAEGSKNGVIKCLERMIAEDLEELGEEPLEDSPIKEFPNSDEIAATFMYSTPDRTPVYSYYGAVPYQDSVIVTEDGKIEPKGEEQA